MCRNILITLALLFAVISMWVGGYFTAKSLWLAEDCPKCEAPAVTALTVDWERGPVDFSSSSLVKGVLYVPAAGMKIASPAEYCRQRKMVLRWESDGGGVLCLEKADKIAATQPEAQASNYEADCKAMGPWAADCVRLYGLLAKMSPPAVMYSSFRVNMRRTQTSRREAGEED